MLIACPDCHSSVSASAKACPKCGLPITQDLIQRIQAKSILAEKEKEKKRSKSQARLRLVAYLASSTACLIAAIGLTVGSINYKKSTDQIDEIDAYKVKLSQSRGDLRPKYQAKFDAIDRQENALPNNNDQATLLQNIALENEREALNRDLDLEAAKSVGLMFEPAVDPHKTKDTAVGVMGVSAVALILCAIVAFVARPRKKP